MDDFLSDITDDMIESIYGCRLRAFEEDERFFEAGAWGNIKEDPWPIWLCLHHAYCLIYPGKSKSAGSSFDEVQKSYALFQKACESILETYFPLLCEEEFLALQSEQYFTPNLGKLWKKCPISRHSSTATQETWWEDWANRRKKWRKRRR